MPLPEMYFDMAQHLVRIEVLSLLAHQLGQPVVGDDDSSVHGILQVVVLDVLPHKSHVVRSGAVLQAGNVVKDLVSLDDLLQVLVTAVGLLAHGAGWRKQIWRSRKKHVWFLGCTKEECQFPGIMLD